jgi:hypothetical protein
MKNLLTLTLLALCFSMAQATTIAITPSSVEVITTSAATRTFYDLDAVFIRYKAANVVVYNAAKSVILFDGDTSEVSVTGATHWGAKAAKLATWYQSATTTTGYRFFYPKRGVNLQYKGSTSVVKLVNDYTSNLLFETHVDSISISGITGASNKLTYFRGQYFLEGLRDRLALPNTPTIAAGAASGASPTIAVAGTGTAFKVTLTTGTTAVSSGTLWTVTLPVTYPTGTIVNVTNANANSALHSVRVFTAGTVSTVVMSATGSALSDATQYIWNVNVTGY